MKLLLFFVDGFGLGEDAGHNPVRSFLRELTGVPFVVESAPHEFTDGLLIAADATGGVSGLPQSATGQTTLMTGVNAPALLGYHLTALPDGTLADLVAGRSLMRRLAEGGVRVSSSNLYTSEYFARRDELERLRERNSYPVSVLTIRSSGARFRMLEDYMDGRALFTDLTNRFLRDRGYDIPLISVSEAAGRMATVLEEADFVFHEYFATDTYTHKKRHDDLSRAIGEIEGFLLRLRNQTDPGSTAILLVSDHGNCEDIRTADHTRNPVPVLLLSRNAAVRDSFRNVRKLEDVYGAVLSVFGLTP